MSGLLKRLNERDKALVVPIEDRLETRRELSSPWLEVLLEIRRDRCCGLGLQDSLRCSTVALVPDDQGLLTGAPTDHTGTRPALATGPFLHW